MTMHSGSCLCGGVRYTLREPISEISVCHCSVCRKASGTAFVAVTPVPAAQLEIQSGRELLRAFESSPGKKRWFCSVCGSPLYSETVQRPGWVRLRIGTLETPLNQRPSYHIFAADKAGWDEIHDGLPQYPANKP